MVPWGNWVKIPSIKKENVRSSTLHCSNAVEKLHYPMELRTHFLPLCHLLIMQVKIFKVNCLQTYFIVLWELEQHNVSIYFTSKVYEDGVSLKNFKTFTVFWMLEEKKVVQRGSHFKQAFSPSQVLNKWWNWTFANIHELAFWDYSYSFKEINMPTKQTNGSTRIGSASSGSSKRRKWKASIWGQKGLPK
jgi:hypothetical protein